MGKLSKIKDEEKKIKIIEFLNKDKERWFSATNISNELGIHYYKAENLLNKLLSENKVEKEERGSYTFWKIKSG
jgi:DNA-binding IclR family transcriptional regulator